MKINSYGKQSEPEMIYISSLISAKYLAIRIWFNVKI